VDKQSQYIPFKSPLSENTYRHTVNCEYYCIWDEMSNISEQLAYREAEHEPHFSPWPEYMTAVRRLTFGNRHSATTSCFFDNNTLTTPCPPWISHPIKTNPQKRTEPSHPLHKKEGDPSLQLALPPHPLQARLIPLPTLGTRRTTLHRREHSAVMVSKGSAQPIWKAVEAA
jgi:hypothetical protein